MLSLRWPGDDERLTWRSVSAPASTLARPAVGRRLSRTAPLPLLCWQESLGLRPCPSPRNLLRLAHPHRTRPPRVSFQLSRLISRPTPASRRTPHPGRAAASP